VCFHYQAWLHTEMIGSLGRWDRYFNTPANHRVHHSMAGEHRDRNFGAVLMIWDRLFGTYAMPASALRYGIAGEVPPASVWQIHVNPLRGRKRKEGAA
jgi:sterol desaturase/sphingolipid hydroxylase (fatty acid hydroxylase superfamily)